jgi:oxygen-dependent protoporphyrinogen oxidase
MLGGPHPLTESHMSLPVIMKHLSSHLGHALPEPLLVRVHAHASCIPTLTVEHLDRMGELKAVLGEAPWEGRLVIGSGVGGVSVGDCVEAGKRVGRGWVWHSFFIVSMFSYWHWHQYSLAYVSLNQLTGHEYLFEYIY